MEQQTTAPTPEVPHTASDTAAHEKSVRFRIAIFGFFLFLVFVVGLFWYATASSLSVGLTLSFVSGLSMIFLPCTLPLAFVIVPLTLGKDPKKGLGMALSFAAGLSITLSFYGVFMAAIGKTFGLKSDVEVWAALLGGAAAFLFGLSEIGVLKFKLPSYSGKFPDAIQRQKDYMKTFLLGLLLGNAGVGCPNPAFYLLLGYIATTGDLFNGWFLGFIHGLGRSVPLIFLAILGTLGINALSGLSRHKEAVERAMGWMLVIIGSYLLTFGIFGHDWFVAGGMHTSWERLMVRIGGERFGETILQHAHKLVDLPDFIQYGNMFFLALLGLTMVVGYFVTRPPKRTVKWLAAIYVVIFLLIGYTTGWSYKIGVNVHIERSSAKSASDQTAPDHAHEPGMADHEESAMMEDTAMMARLGQLPLRTPADRVELLPYVIKNGVKEFVLEASEFRWEYAKGKWMHVWGYNNQIPAPEIRVAEGDRVRVIVRNRLPDATTVHWHGLDVPWQMDGVAGITQDAIPPGSEFVYEFDAIPAGTRFYHSHGKDHMTSAQQLDMGLSGAFIVEPSDPEDEPQADRDYTLVLDEWEISAGGANTAVSHTHGMGEGNAGDPAYNTFTINGRVFPYTDILKVKEGESVRVRFINAGTTAFHPMHLHGHSFTVIAKDGFIIPRAAREKRNTITVHPGETVDILIQANNPGPWLLHCHHVHHAAAGMITLLQYEGMEPIKPLDAGVTAGGPAMKAPAPLTAATPSAPPASVSTKSVPSAFREEADVREGLVVNFNVSPVPVKTSTPVRLDFFVNEKPGNVPVPVSQLEVSHEKLMHVIGVRSDLEEFFHVHPMSTTTVNLLARPYEFSKPGLYKLWSEIKKDGVVHTFGHPEISVQGEGPREEKRVSFERNKAVNNYEVSLSAVAKPAAGQDTAISFDIHSPAGEIELENYLGEPMHLAIIKDDLKRFMHVHPVSNNNDGHMHSDAGSFVPAAYANGGDTHDAVEEAHGTEFHVVFPQAGLYKAFVQFRPRGVNLGPDEALVASFWIEVQEKKPIFSAWWGLLLFSAVAMVLLSFGVKKYIHGARARSKAANQ